MGNLRLANFGGSGFDTGLRTVYKYMSHIIYVGSVDPSIKSQHEHVQYALCLFGRRGSVSSFMDEAVKHNQL